MLRTFFVRLSENKSIAEFCRAIFAGAPRLQPLVAGTEIADAVRATQAVNRARVNVTIDNLR